MTDTTDVPNIPALPGLAFRAFRGSEDLPGLAAVRAACRPADRVDPLSAVEHTPDLEDLARTMVPEPGFDPATDVLVVFADERIIGYEGVIWWTEDDGTWLYLSLGWLVPEWRGRGIGTAMLHWAEAHSRALAATHPTGGNAVYGANASETEREATALLLHEGYAVALTVIEMGIDDLDLPPALLADGFVIRPVEASDLPAIFRSMTECYSDVVHRGPGDDYDAWAAGQDPAEWHVAWDAATGEIAGQVKGELYKGRGELAEVSVRVPYRRKRLARALIVHALHALRDRGAATARLHTLAGNVHDSPRVYESIGFRLLKRYPRYRKVMTA